MTIVDLSSFGHIEVTGTDRVRFLQGVTTVNISGLPPGGHGWGAILSPKGRVLSVLEATVEPERVLLYCEPVLVDKTLALLDKYAVMDDVTSRAIELVAHKRWDSPAEAWTAPILFTPPPGPVTDAAALEVARVEAGLLRYGQDVDEDTFPFETPIGRFLDYAKGCYVGQEPVFRVYAQGQAARTMRGLLIEGDSAVTTGATVTHPSRPNAGKITSAVVSPRLGSIAMAYLHRSIWDVGGEVTVDGRRATVTELPFP